MLTINFLDDPIHEPTGKILHVDWGYKNYGNSPAFVTKVDGNLVHIKKGEGMAPEPDFSDAEHLDFSIPLAPGEKREVQWNTLEIGIVEADREALIKEEDHLVFYGMIEYYDVFDNRHETRFCLSYVKPVGLVGPGFEWKYSGDEHYNRHT